MNPPAEFALKRHLPAVDAPWVSLGEYPTPVEPLPAMESVWLKREDVSSPLYGGNKIRTLETLLGDARSKGIHKVWTLGAYGSNQAIALIVHGKRLGFETGGVLFPHS